MEYNATEAWMIGLAEKLIIKAAIPRDIGIYFVINIDCDNFGYEKDGNTRHNEWKRRDSRHLHYIVTKPHTVFFKMIQDRSGFKHSTLTDGWRMHSDHDSCWRNTGFSAMYEQAMKSYEVAWDHMPEEHKRAPISAHISTSPSSLTSNIFRFVRLDIAHKEYDSEVPYYERKVINKITFLKEKISFEEE